MTASGLKVYHTLLLHLYSVSESGSAILVVSVCVCLKGSLCKVFLYVFTAKPLVCLSLPCLQQRCLRFHFRLPFRVHQLVLFSKFCVVHTISLSAVLAYYNRK